VGAWSNAGMQSPNDPAVRLVRPPPGRRRAPPVLDRDQQVVVDHHGGPLLVLAGPGTGKTTTLVEAVVERVHRGTAPDQILVLTFSRAAAGQLRERIAARLDVVSRQPLAMTFHGYAYALCRREAPRLGQPAPRLLSGPETDLTFRRLLAGEAEDGGHDWPVELRPALRTRGFARELADLVARARERGLDGAELASMGARVGRVEWIAVGRFWQRAADVAALDPTGPALDYAGLVRRAADLLEDPEIGGAERGARRAVFVDEYQDTDPAQERLLASLAGGGRDLVVVGDPDQAIYGFRGADVGGLLGFPDRFRTVGGAPAPVRALMTSRRCAGDLLSASRRLAARLPAAPGRGHRALTAAAGIPDGSVEVLRAASRAQEATLVADTLRRARLVDGVPWSRMAVLVRSAVRSLPTLRRALAAAGVPTTVVGDEIPLIGEPVVRHLLLLLRAALAPASLDEDIAVELLSGPLGRGDPLAVRRLRRALLAAEPPGGRRRPSGDLLVEAMRPAGDLGLIDPSVARPAQRIADLMTGARAAAAGGNAEDVLWAVWSASGLAGRWERAAVAGGATGRLADRALDAVVALFDVAGRFVDRLPGAGPLVFLDDLAAQEIPADTLAERAPADDSVRLLSAHRAKGLEWDVVVVAGVQEGSWPDQRVTGSLLGIADLVDALADRPTTPASAAAAALAEERRLFYVAVTRSRRRLVVTAVSSDEEQDERPSRFLDELVGESPADPPARAARMLSLPALVAELRAHLLDGSVPEPVRAAAAVELARLAVAGVPGAHPDGWYALTELSDPGPITDPDAPVAVSPSAVEGFERCALRWFLERSAGASSPPGAAQTVGSIVHALAAIVGAAELNGEAVDEAQLIGRLDAIWPGLDLGGVWFSRKQRDAAALALRRFLGWAATNPRMLVAVEQGFRVESGRAVVSGRVDRLERDDAGRAVVIDLKTGSARVGEAVLPTNPQLGVYQLAVALGAFADVGLAEPGGAALVQLGRAANKAGAREQAQVALADAEDPDWAARLLDRVVLGMSGAEFPATVGADCRNCPVQGSCPAQPSGRQVGTGR